jgi:hypothetical protein
MPLTDSKKDLKQKKDKKEKSSTTTSRSSSKQLVSKPRKTKTPKKEGGALVNDVKNLAVPFAILLAKEGLSKYFKESKTTETKKTSSSKTSSSSKPSSTSRRRTMTGGTCNMGCGALTGGAASKQLFELQKQIDNFLEKY